MWSLANAPDHQRNVTVDTAGSMNHSTFPWLNVKAATGYEALWRQKDQPFWTSRIVVGDVEEVTVKISKDNVEFRIQSVGANDYRSPAVFSF
jgi:hypothetical protein